MMFTKASPLEKSSSNGVKTTPTLNSNKRRRILNNNDLNYITYQVTLQTNSTVT